MRKAEKKRETIVEKFFHSHECTSIVYTNEYVAVLNIFTHTSIKLTILCLVTIRKIKAKRIILHTVENL